MKIELFIVSDFAADYSGKLSVIGIFDTLSSKQAPVTHPHWCVAIKLRFEKIEEGQKRLRLSIADADGKPVIPSIDMSIAVSVPSNLPSITVNLVMNIGGIKFERFGEYSIDLAIDGRHEATTPIYVRQIA